MTTFTDQIAVVTGASSGIGKAIALSLAAQGATLCLIGRNQERLEAVAATARVAAPRTLISQIDLTRDAEIEQLAMDLRRKFGQVDVLVHCAGAIYLGKLRDAAIAELDAQYQANVRAVYLLTQAMLPLLRVRPGQIAFINSSAGLTSGAGVGQFSATQHALKAIADSLRQEVNADGIRVLSVFPGRTATPRQASLHEIEGKRYQPELLMQPEDVATVMVNALGLPRTAEVTDVSIRPMIKPTQP